MKDTKIIAAICIAVGLTAAGLAIKAGMDNFTNRSRQVTVKGLAEKEVKADKVAWMTGVSEKAVTTRQAREQAKQSAKELVRFLQECGIKPADIIEGSLHVSPDQKYNESTKSYETIGYVATKDISVSSKDVDVVRKAYGRMDELTDRGVNINERNEYSYTEEYGGSYNNIFYEIEDFQSMKLELMDEAIVNAQAAAERFAKSSNSDVGKIISANQGEISIKDKDRLTSHVKKVRVVSTITYALKD